jgi:hypothetical protein
MAEYRYPCWLSEDLDVVLAKMGEVLILGLYRYLWKLERLAEWEAEHKSR